MACDFPSVCPGKHIIGRLRMGVSTWNAFAGTDEQAVAAGDFAAREKELQPLLKALRSGCIDIVAIRQHMTHEQPRYVFLPYREKARRRSLPSGEEGSR